ncbi:VOC family protein [Metabacillus sp. RGM 3146]|uniref:VOC family protein n=1 Tax=Metabacillus sp. RGM 3146 TaxID=3401092 RepID=UPI003B9BA70B
MSFHKAPATFVSKVSLLVEDLERSLSFYKEKIGFQVLEQTATKAVLTADGKTPLLSIEQPDNLKTGRLRTTGLYHFALLLPKRADLANVLMHFLETGYPLQGASDHLVSEALYLADPDGNGIEIYRDRPSDEWEWNGEQVHMTTEPLQAENLLAERTPEGWQGLPSETVMGHIHLQVSNLHNTETFYTKGLGFDVVTKYGAQALFISTERYHHHIGLNTWNSAGAEAPEENSAGLKSYTLQFPDHEAREKVLRKLAEAGAKVFEQDGVPMVKDPSGITIELDV